MNCLNCGQELGPEDIDGACSFCGPRLAVPDLDESSMELIDCLEEICCLVLPECASDSRWYSKIRGWLKRAGFQYNNDLNLLERIEDA